ncbi:uncharacterized protein [Littorina saxatilis]|uniref:uncharacterized protein n=1 Tax=Littorina saxatilis TaxID=31220 RepID=UPI0038B56018
MACHCPMIDCDNGSYRLQNGKLNFAKFSPTRFHTSLWPTTVQLASASNTQEETSTTRLKWIRLISRVDTTADGRHKLFSPAKDARVCSLHFLDGTPTAENSFPTQNLGYPGFQHRTARVLIDIPRPKHRLGRRKWAMRDLEFQFEACQAQGSPRERNGVHS